MVAKINYQNIRNGPYSIKTNLVNNPVHKDKGDLTEENLIDGMMKHDIFVQMPPKSRSSYYLTKHSSKNEEILDRLEKIEKRLTDLECKMFPERIYYSKRLD